MERFGAGRLIWGSNFPATYEPSYGEMAAMGREAVGFLTPDDRDAVLGGNAQRLWNIQGGMAR